MSYTIHELTTLYQAYEQQQPFDTGPQALYAPIRYILSLGGKKIRPLLVLVGCNMMNTDPRRALPAAFAVELFHNFTLMHDDIMDAAPLRRGKPTVHIQYNVNTAILSGDAMLIKSYEYLLRSAEIPNGSSLLALFSQTALEVCEGQQMDVNFETQELVALPEYIEMIALKTSVLLAAALKIGVLIGGGSQHDAECAYHFAKNIGIAFQIQDDLLDSFGDPEKFGKQVGGDIVQNKQTYLVIKSFELATPAQAERLRTLRNSQNTLANDLKIAEVKAIFNELGVPQATRTAIQHYESLALAQLSAMQVPDSNKKPLYELADTLINRQY
jgi:geranylgeranyl diphosphate synthase type II